MEGAADKLLDNITKRLRLNAFLQYFAKSILILSCIYLTLILISRFSGLIPDIFTLKLSLVPLILAILISYFSPHKTSKTQAARSADDFAKTDDLFLTDHSLATASGEFKKLIHKQAQEKASNLKAEEISPLKASNAVKNLLLSIIPILILSLFMPQFDPFGQEEIRQKSAQKKKVIEEERKITAKRLSVLKKQKALPKESEQIKAELTEIFKDFKKVAPKEQTKKIREKRRKIAKAWTDKNRDLQSEKKSSLKTQSIGAMSDKMKKILQDLKKNQTQSAAASLKKIAEELQELSEKPDSEEKQQQVAKLKQQMSEIKDMLNNEMGADSVKAAIDRALRQLNDLDNESMQALKDAAKSMELSERELQRLQKLMDEMDELQKMMQTAQSAEKYAQNQQGKQGQQNGQKPPEYSSFEEYEQFFNQQNEPCEPCEGGGICESCNSTGKDADGETCKDCQGKGTCDSCGGSGSKPGSGQMMASGTGTGNPGQGGGKPGENSDIETDFKKEQSKSKNKAGKILMQWKTKGQSEKGEVTVEYEEALQEIKEGVDEAIVKERIPPGYHEVIKKYFSSDSDSTED